MDYFIAQARIVLPVLGINILRSVATAIAEPLATDGALTGPTSSPTFTLTLLKEGITASAREVDGEFIVDQGSFARHAWTGTPTDGYRRLREQLEQDQTLRPLPDGTKVQFARDQVLASPSAAAAVVVGRPVNGRLDRKLADGTTYGAWQQQGVDGSPNGSVAL
ncbi:DUF4357 domain-containing protein [Pseudonocardia sp. GCM10023141]|uniref:DUF4357 domain-containing protein n=1 Tax=Pseudonocardia sp. GCM10023141 TaxID=3252653 RepID=UPI003618AFCE